MANTLSTVGLQTRVYSDIAINFQPNPITGDLLKVTGVNSVAQAIVNLVSTNHYERLGHPEIGGNVRKLLFEQADGVTAQLLSKEIKDVIANYEPRATVLDVIVQTASPTSSSTMTGYQITINFLVAGVQAPISISMFLKRLR